MPAKKLYSAKRVKDLHAEGLTDAEVAAVLGCHPSRASQIRRALGLKPNKWKCRPWLASEVKSVAAGIEAGLTYAEIGAGIGRTAAAVLQAVQRYDMANQTRYHHPLERWSRAWNLFAAGASAGEVAECLGVHRTTAFKYKRIMPKDWAKEVKGDPCDPGNPIRSRGRPRAGQRPPVAQ